MSYRVELPVFSGPMDLLLHLVRQQELNIHEVSIAPILDSYLKHLGVLQQLDLHDIGDFVVMASTLMEIKSRELLPSEAVEIEQELDPRDDLIRRLLEYKRYRDLARELEGRAEKRAQQLPLVLANPQGLSEKDEEDLLDLGNVGIWEITSAFAKLLEEIGQQSTMQVEVEKRDVGYYTERLLTRFRQRREVRFSDIFDRSEGRYGLIGTLIALLEMMKQGYLRAHQENCFDEIHLAFRGDDGVTATQILAGISAEEAQQAAANEAEDAAMADFAAREFARSTEAADDTDAEEASLSALLDAAMEQDAGEDEVDEEPSRYESPEAEAEEG